MTWVGPPPRKTVVPGDGSQQERLEAAIGALETGITADTALLWTGGKEANVLADLLLYAIGDGEGVSPVPFAVIDTGNHFDAMYEFRDEFVAPDGDQGRNTIGPPTGIGEVIELRYDEMLDHIIDNEADPRGYHGRHQGAWSCPECGATIADPEDGQLSCHICEAEADLHPVQTDNMEPEEWGVPESCGALKVVPIRRLIEDYGFDTLITGRRGEDPLTPGDDHDLAMFEERKNPAPHDRVNPLADWSETNVYAYVKQESVSLSTLYTEDGYRHTDAMCCVDRDADVGEYGEGGRDPQKQQARDRLEQMGYV